MGKVPRFTTAHGTAYGQHMEIYKGSARGDGFESREGYSSPQSGCHGGPPRGIVARKSGSIAPSLPLFLLRLIFCILSQIILFHFVTFYIISFPSISVYWICSMLFRFMPFHSLLISFPLILVLEAWACEKLSFISILEAWALEMMRLQAFWKPEHSKCCA